MLDWKNIKASDVLKGSDENGSRLVSLFAKDYKIIMGSDICPSCKDFNVKYLTFIKKLETMNVVKNSGFKLKAMYNNITLHGSQTYYNNDNLTDEKALELIEKHPKGTGLFDEVPENLEELQKESKADENITLLGKEFTVDQAKPLFKTAKIETKAKTAKGLEAVLEKITDDQKPDLEKAVAEYVAE